MLGQAENLRHLQPRFPILFYAIFLGFGVLTLRLINLQVIRGSEYRKFSDRNSLRRDKLQGPRGLIFDRSGKLLVDNRLQLDVVITPQFVRNLDEVIQRLSQISNIGVDRLRRNYDAARKRTARFQAITIIPNANWSVVAQIESSKEGLSGVDIEPRLMRSYLEGEIGAQVYGYLGEVNNRDIDLQARRGFVYESGDFIGRGGIEMQWERYLRGQDGVRFVVVDAHGHRVIRNNESVNDALNLSYEDVPPKAGNNLILTLDSDLQRAAWDAMEGMMGATVALDTRTGEVLAMISKPSFDASVLDMSDASIWQGLMRNPYGPLRNKTIQDHYPPGSTFKPFTALAAMENNIITRDTILKCPPIIHFGRRPFHEHNKNGFGNIGIVEAIMRSSNVFMWQLAMKLDVNQIADVAMAFGLGHRTGIDLPGETPGLIPTREWKEKTFKDAWYPGETLSVAIGQGSTAVTPLQLALSYAVIANGGLLYKPYIVSRVTDSEGKLIKEYKPILLRKRESSAKHLDTIREGLHDVINKPGGTAYWHGRINEVKIAGKSGTTQVMSKDAKELFAKCEDMPFHRRNHAWFVGFAPYENPEIVVASFGMHECAGSRRTSPIVRAVIQKWWEKKKARESLEGPQPASTP
jgi:penicillin-binding protein 2